MKSIYKSAEKRFDAGDIPKAQVIKVKLELTKAEYDLLSKERELTYKKISFNNLLGRQVTSEVILKKISFPVLQISDISELKKLAYKSRPLLLASLYQIKAKESQLTTSSYFFLPEATLAYYQNDLFNSDIRGVSFSLSFPVFDWGKARGEIEQAKLDVKTAEYEFKNIEKTIDMEIEENFLKVTEAQNKINFFENNLLKESEQLLKMAQKGYEKGEFDILDVLEAQRTLKEVQTEYQQVYMDYQTAVLQLEKAVGQNIFTQGEIK